MKSIGSTLYSKYISLLWTFAFFDVIIKKASNYKWQRHDFDHSYFFLHVSIHVESAVKLWEAKLGSRYDSDE